MQSHIKVVAVLHIVLASLNLVIGAIVFIFLGGMALLIPMASQEPNAAIASGLIFVFLITFSITMILTSLPGILAGVGLLRHAGWGRILTIILSILYIPFHIPLGTILGIYSLWVMFSDDTIRLFSDNQQASTATPSHNPEL